MKLIHVQYLSYLKIYMCFHEHDCIYKYDMFYLDFFRASIFKVHLERIKTEMDKVALAKKMASLTSGFSGRHAHFITVEICT